jgi:hypothetical protein
VEVWLCADHRSDEFQRRRAGRDFSVSLTRLWRAAGCLTAARSRALDAHRASVLAADRPGERPRPGSYSWPALRREAEGLWARGERAGEVIGRLRAREQGRPGPARPPSRRTMYRWFREGRWLGEGGDDLDVEPEV